MIDINKLEQVCTECGGTGLTTHPEWNAYWERQTEIKEEYKGKGLSEEDAFYKAGEDVSAEEPSVPEEMQCGLCDGKGTMLTQEGNKLMDFVRRHL